MDGWKTSLLLYGAFGVTFEEWAKKTWGVYSDVKDLEKMDEEMLAYEGNRLLL